MEHPRLFNTDQLVLLESTANVVHFTGPEVLLLSDFLNPHAPFASKPWAYLCYHPLKEEFFEYLDQTLWKGWRPSVKDLVDGCLKDLKSFAAKVGEEATDDFNEEEFLGNLQRQLQLELQRFASA